MLGGKAAAGPTVSVTGNLQLMKGSVCKSKIPAVFANAPYVLEGNFSNLAPGAPRLKEAPRRTLIIKSSLAAPVPGTTRPSPIATSGPRLPLPTPVRTTSAPAPIDYSFLSTCLPLYAQSSMTNKFVGKKVVATGVMSKATLYAVSIRLAGVCKEQCPGTDGILRNCTPPEADGSSADSICSSTGKVESCGGKTFCCPAAGGKWTTDMTKCQPPTPVPTVSTQTSCSRLGGYCVAASSCVGYGSQVGTGYLCGNVPYSCCTSPVRSSPTSTPTPVPTSVAVPAATGQ